MTTPQGTSLPQILSLRLGHQARNKALFRQEAQRVLKALAEAMGLSEGEYDIRSNAGGDAVSGEVILHTDQVYVQISKSLMGRNADVLYRACNGRDDKRYYEHRNHLTSVAAFEDLESFARHLNRLADRAQERKGLASGPGFGA